MWRITCRLWMQQQACVYFWRQIVLAAQRTTSSVIRIHYLYEERNVASGCSRLSPRQYALKQRLTTGGSGPPNLPTLCQQLVSKPSRRAELLNSHPDSRRLHRWLIFSYKPSCSSAVSSDDNMSDTFKKHPRSERSSEFIHRANGAIYWSREVLQSLWNPAAPPQNFARCPTVFSWSIWIKLCSHMFKCNAKCNRS